MSQSASPVSIEVDEGHRVSALLSVPSGATALLVLAHGAGAGMTHPFMTSLADGLSARNIATLRYQFPYMESGARRPDRPALAQATVRAAVETAGRLAPGLPLVAGGKSFGGRMTSQAQSEAALPGIRGLVFLGFPLHPAKQPGVERAAHLANIRIPLLFVQGTRDALADIALIRRAATRLGPVATLEEVDAANHSFHVPSRSGRTNDEVLGSIVGTMVAWIGRPLGALSNPAGGLRQPA